MSLPDGCDDCIDRFTKSGGLPQPLAEEAVRIDVRGPDVDAIGVEVPESLKVATIFVSMSSGAADVDFVARSRSEASAASDARWLTQCVNRAVTVDLALLQLEILGPYEFIPRGRKVHGHAVFTAEETRWIVAMARKLRAA